MRLYLFYFLVISRTPDLSSEYKSTTAKSLYFVLGSIPLIKEFDKHHELFKNFKYQQSAAICENLIKQFQKQVKEKYIHFKTICENWDTDFFSKNFVEPTHKDMNNEIYKSFKAFQHAKSLIKKWKLS